MSRVRGFVPPFFMVVEATVTRRPIPSSIGWTIVSRDGTELSYGLYNHDPLNSRWEEKAVRFDLHSEMYSAFWDRWTDAQTEFPGIVLATSAIGAGVDRFVEYATLGHDDPFPSPMHSLQSVFLAMGIDPLDENETLEDEQNDGPLGKARKTARLLTEMLEGVEFTGTQPEQRPAVLPPPTADQGMVAVNVERTGDRTTISFDRTLSSLTMPNTAAEQFGLHIVREARVKDRSPKKVKAR